ncbi:D-alanyl-D-alanine carboxypeptidase [Streptomyces sp. NPDC050508]|uniref:D-alanyl-D-alanine carboxypeptidase n=1 Tax=Streptomyces sp. NPDC050508 TaxID=3155405 RepID=UPI003422DE5A
MEEASVAGESPDRSKQRESSAEPTSGSASPVPEARGARDPRLAVAREDTTPATAQRGGVDTATKVFSIRELKSETAEADGAGGADRSSGAGEVGGSSGSSGSAEGSDSGDSEPTAEQNPSAKGGKEGDARLRAAVAAWVSTSDEPGEQDESGEPNEQDGEEVQGSEEAAEAAEAAEAEGSESPESSDDSERVADADDPEEAEETGEAEESAGGTGEVSADEDAEEPTEGTEAEDAGETSATDVPDAETAEETDEATDAGEQPESGDEAADAADAEAEAEVEVEVDGDDDATEGEAVDDTEPEAAAGPEAAAEGDTDAEIAADADADAEIADTDTDEQPKAADDEPAPKGPPAPDDETRTGGAGGDTKAADGEAEAVDQPTAVFKAPRPPKPAVDQPTTMLKLGGATKTPESEAERTSRFVALKPLDEPRRDATRPVAQVGPERTTQVPLPPKPPLDLLAELTNTPPPPETPVRTAIRRVKIWTPLVILLAIVFAVVQAVRPLPAPSLALTADDSYTFDGSKVDLPWPSEGQGWMDVNGIGTMGNFGKQTPVAIGSVAKAMTAYIVLKDHPLKSGAEGEKITVDATAEKEGGYDKDGESTLNTVKAGDVLTEKQALSAIMIPSANNIARLLARWDAGSEAAFIKKMNDTAKALGMTNTTYTDASGLKETTVSSAEDQVKLGNQLVKIQALMDITKLPSWVDPSGKKWTNYNRLVPYNNSLGIKTGTTTAAGGNLLFAATKEVGGETAVVVGAILGQHTAPIIDTVNAVSKTAMLAAQDAMTSAKILKKGTVVGYVDDQLGGHTPVVVTKDVAAVGWAGLRVKLSFASDSVPHTAKAGTKVGTLTVGDGSGDAVKVPVALQKDLAEPALTAKLTRLG